MHILILADTVDNQKAGIHFYTKNLISALLKIDKENSYTFIHSRPNDFFKNTNHYIIPQKRGFGSETIRRFIKIPKLIKSLHPDIVLEPCHIGPFRLPKSIRKAVVIHDLTPILFPKFHIRRSVIIHKLFLKKTLKNADLIITPSQSTANDIRKFCKISSKITPIHLGISPPIANPPLSSIKKPYILFLGTIEPRKNLKMLIDAFSELKAEHNIPHRLVLAGEIGWKSGEILKKTHLRKDIILTGYVTEEEKAALYAGTDMFVYPSIYEGFGLPPLEAMSYGIPVICSTGGSLKEIFSDHALTFSPADKDSLKAHILSLINNPHLKTQLSDSGKTYASTFTRRKAAAETLKALTS
ncbi:MAG: glycosyltransferase family 1 protein [Candidatus Peregrinibacteria bacterium]